MEAARVTHQFVPRGNLLPPENARVQEKQVSRKERSNFVAASICLMERNPHFYREMLREFPNYAIAICP